MKTVLNRREFLKLAGLLSLSSALPGQILNSSIAQENARAENVLILVFDAWSASNTSLYGYDRKTTPHLDRLAEKAIVYHNHFATGHFTTPGTASILTGTLPWTHHAFDLYETVDSSMAEKNIFNAFRNYHRAGYTHNPVADIFLKQFSADISKHTPWEKLFINSNPLMYTLFQDDQDVASISWNRALQRLDEGYSYSLYLSQLYEKFKTKDVDNYPQFPRGLPNFDGLSFFTLEEAIDWLANQIEAAPQPFFGYYHLYPPHGQYFTREDFIDKFADDGYQPPDKPLHFLHINEDYDYAFKKRRYYDEFILYVDEEFARLYNYLEQSGALENTWLILTSDHGEMFERGILKHMTPAFFQPVVHVPLLIFPPGQNTRIDIHNVTSAIDILPTLLHVTGQEIPDWAEGEILPPFIEAPETIKQDAFSVQIFMTHDTGQKSSGTAMMVRENYKLMLYFGYDEINEGDEIIELYDISADPEELENLYPSQKTVADEMLAVLRVKLNEFMKSNRSSH